MSRSNNDKGIINGRTTRTNQIDYLSVDLHSPSSEDGYSPDAIITTAMVDSDNDDSDGSCEDSFDDEYDDSTKNTTRRGSPQNSCHGERADFANAEGSSVIRASDDNGDDNNDDNADRPLGIDRGAVSELVGDLRELQTRLILLMLLFATITVGLGLDDFYYWDKGSGEEESEHALLRSDTLGAQNIIKNKNKNNPPPHPHMGHKLQLNASAFTANDFECLQLDTGNWPSERVHCELLPSATNDNKSENDHETHNYETNNDYDNDYAARYAFVVEHFDDGDCRQRNRDNPVVRHTASGCYYYEAYNHSYHDLCHSNRTFTVSAFVGPGCLVPLPVTAVNLLPEDGEGDEP
eukprot:jgi/Psemu1/600/gm1.600_g